MPEKTQYIIKVPGENQIAYWSEDKFRKNEQQLFKDHPDVEVTQYSEADPNAIDESANYEVSVSPEEEPSKWSGAKLAKNRDALLKDYPNAVIRKMSDYSGRLNKDFARQYEYAVDKTNDDSLPATEKQPYIDYVNQQSGRYDAIKGQFGRENQPPVPDSPEVKPITTLIGGLSQSVKQSAGGFLKAVGETARISLKNIFGPHVKDSQLAKDAINEIDRRIASGEDPLDYDIPKITEGYASLSKEKKKEVDRLVNIATLIASRKHEGDDINSLRERLAQEAGDVSPLERVINAGDEIIEANSQPVEGWAKVGSMVPLAAAAAGSIAASAAIKNPALARTVSSAINKGTMAAFAASTAGSAMKAAQDAGANDTQTLAAGVASAGIMYGIGQIPIGRYTENIIKSAAKDATKELGLVMKDATAREMLEREFQQLLNKASKELGVKATSKYYIENFLGHVATSTTSFAAMGGLEELVPLIYESPEDYPIISNVIKGSLEGALDGLAMGAIFGGITTGIDYAQRHQRWRNQGYLWAGEAEFSPENSDILVKENGKWVASKADESGKRFVEVVGYEPESGREMPVSASQAGAGSSPASLYVIMDGKLCKISPTSLKRSFRIDAPNAERKAAEWQHDRAIEAGENADTPEARSGITQEYKYQQQKPEDFSFPLDAQAYERNMAEAAMQGRREAMRQSLEGRIGKPFTFVAAPDGGNAQEFVSIINYADGHQVFVMTTDEQGNLAGVTDDGKNVYIKRDYLEAGLADGSIAAYNKRIPINEYLDSLVRQQDEADEQERMAQEQAQNLSNLIDAVSKQTHIDVGTPEAESLAEIVEIDPLPEGGVKVKTEDGEKVLSWEQVADRLHLPFQPLTNDEIVQQRLDADRQSMRGPQSTSTNGVSAPLPPVSGEEAPEGQPNAQPIPQQAAAPAVVYDDDVANQLGLAPKYSRVNSKGATVVNTKELWEKDPALWAKYNDLNPRKSTSTMDYIAERVKQLDAEISKQQSLLRKEESGNMDQDKIDSYNDKIDQLSERRSLIDGILQEYVQAEAAQKQAEADARAAEFQAKVEEKKAAQAKKEADLQQNISDDEQFQQIQHRFAGAKKVQGAPDMLVFGGQEFPGHYYLVEAETPTASHQATQEWTPVPGFPKDETGRSLNTRDYEHERESQQHVLKTASDYDSRALQHMVVMTSDGIVISGNERTMASQIAAQNNTDAKYVDYLAKYPQKFGLTAEQVAEFKHPRVVFVPDGALAYTAKLFDLFNQSEEKRQNAVATAAKVAKITDDNLVLQIATLMQGVDDINKVYQDPKMANTLMSILESAKVTTREDRPMYLDQEGKLTGAGEDFVESVLFGSIFSTSDQAVRDAMADKSIRRAVAYAFPVLVRVKNMPAEYSIINEMTEAVSLLVRAKAANGGKVDDALSSYMNQFNLFTEGLPEEKGLTQLLANTLADKRYSSLRTNLNQFVQRLEDAGNGQTDLMSGGIVETKEQILKEVLEFNNIDTTVYDNARRKIPQNDEVRLDAGDSRADGSPAVDGGPETDTERPAGARGDSSPEGTAQGGEVAAAVEAARQEVDTNPTEAQKEAGNYKKGHLKLDGYDITIENPKGSIRRGVDADGKAWETPMNNDYGYLRRTEGVDGDHIDVFLSDNPSEGNVFVVDQVNPKTGQFDEHKVMYGFPNAESARSAYLSNYSEGWQGLGTITEVTKDEFKKWVESSHRKTKPFSEYKSVKAEGAQNENSARDNTKQIAGLENYSREEIQSLVEDYIRQQLSEVEPGEFTVKSITPIGSRTNGTSLPDSDLDVLVEYEGTMREDDAFNMLHADNPLGEGVLEIEGIKVDINPIRAEESGSAKSWIKKHEAFRKREAQINAQSAAFSLMGTTREEVLFDMLRDDFAEIDGRMRNARTQNEVDAIMEDKAAAIQRYIDKVKTNEASVVTVKNIESRLISDGLPEEIVGYVVDGIKFAAEHNSKPLGFTAPGGRIYMVADNLRNPEFVRGNYVHERQHHITHKKGYDAIMLSMANNNREDLTRFLQPFIAVKEGLGGYEEADNLELANELVSFCMEVAYTVPSNEVIPVLRDRFGIDNENILNFVKKIDDEQRKDNALSAIRRPGTWDGNNLPLTRPDKASDGISTDGGSGQNERNFQADAGRQLEGEADRPLERGLQGTGGNSASRERESRVRDLDQNGRVTSSVTREISGKAHEGTVLFSLTKDDKSLVGLHNISPDNLSKAIRLGGLANPSAAVIDIDRQDHFGYGSISLVMPSSLVDMKTGHNAGTWDRDAWTPQYPNVSLFDGKQTQAKLKQLTNGVPDAELAQSIRRKVDAYIDGDVYNSGLEYVFLQQKGLAPEIQTKPRRYPYLTVEQIMEAIGVPADTNTSNHELWYGTYESLPQEQILKVNQLYFTENRPENIEYREERMAKNSKFREALMRHDSEVLSFAAMDSFVYRVMVDQRDAGEKDISATISKAIDYVRDNGLAQEFGEWQTKVIDDLGYEEKIFLGYTPSGTRRYMPNTLENVSKWMKKQGRNASSDHSQSGPGILKARLARKFTNLQQIRKHKGNLTNDERDPRLEDIGKRLSDAVFTFYNSKLAEYSGMYTAELVAQEYAEDVLVRGLDIDRVVERFNEKESVRISLTDEQKEGFKKLREDLIDLPAFYFETKFERPVYLNEFAAAVLPSDTPQAIKEYLSEQQIPIYEYEDGNGQSRRSATLKAAEIEGVKFSFIGEIGAARLDAQEGAPGRVANLEIARQMESTGKDARSIKLATGWERGKDGLWRYEIMDFKKVDPAGNIDYDKRHPDFVRYKELIRKSNASIFVPEENPALSADEREELGVLSSIYGGNTQRHQSSKLKDYVDYDELFAAYPELRGAEVRFVDFGDKPGMGYADMDKNEIVIDKVRRWARNFDEIIAHEIQHLIQSREGFSEGTSLEDSARKAQRMSVDPLTKYQKQFIHDVEIWASQDAKSKEDYPLEKFLSSLESTYDWDFFSDNILGKTYDELRREFNRLKRMDNAKRIVSPYDVYRRTSGEVEARNVVARRALGLDEEGMRMMLAADTEDVDRKDQILNMPVRRLLDVDDLNESAAPEQAEGRVSFSVVEDAPTLDKLNSQPTITVYRSMALIDGKLYPPMSMKEPGSKELRHPVELGQWVQSDEDPQHAYQKGDNGKWYYDLNKFKGRDASGRKYKGTDNKGVLYNPYIHTSASPLNDQFSSAWMRPELVTVETEVPVSELTSGYKAEKANDAVGAKDWHSGTVTSQLGEGRQVILSRWAKPVRIVPDSEIAEIIAPKLKEKGISVPYNVVTPSLRAELEKRGVDILDESSGLKKDGGVKFSLTAYHGSRQSFDRFDHSHMGEGEGAQAHGWGSYVAFKKRTARKYAERPGSDEREQVNNLQSLYDSLVNDWQDCVRLDKEDVKRLREQAKADGIDEVSKQRLQKFASDIDTYGSPLTQQYDKAASLVRCRISMADMPIRPKAFDGSIPLESAWVMWHAAQLVNEAGGVQKAKDYYRDGAAQSNPGSSFVKAYNFLAMTTEDDWVSNRQLYTVEIPDDTGENYLNETFKVGDDEIRAVYNALQERRKDDALLELQLPDNWSFEEFKKEVDPGTGEYLYWTLGRLLGGPREASRFLNELGYAGMKYTGATDGDCAVIFNEADIAITDHVRFSFLNESNRIFVSNAEKAVQDIQQEKGTPEQWLKMIEGKGGLKAGEDKWLGLSGWLNEQKGSITKQEVMDYIAQNRIQIEEVRYSQNAEGFYADAISSYQNEYANLVEEGKQKGVKNPYVFAYDKMSERYGDDFDSAFERNGDSIMPSYDYYGEEFSDAAKYFLDKRRDNVEIRAINTTRLEFTSGGLSNKREIALTVPTIEPWNEHDNIHFGDAGGGRAVAWARFGDAYGYPVGLGDEKPHDYERYKRDLEREIKKNQELLDRDTKGRIRQQAELDLIAAQQKLKRLESDFNDVASKRGRVLVIDELQSKRHQEGREKGYDDGVALKEAIARRDRAIEEYKRYGDELQKKYGAGYNEGHAEGLLSEAERKERSRLYGALQAANSIVMRGGFNPMEDAEYVSLRQDWEKAYDELVAERRKVQPQILKINKRLYEISDEAEKEALRAEKDQLNKSSYQFEQKERFAENAMKARELSLEHDFKKKHGGIPSAPFEKNWHELAMKRMLRLAAEEGYDYVAWTTGEQQAERYNIGNVVNQIEKQVENGFQKVYIDLKDDSTITLTTNSKGNILESTGAHISPGAYNGRNLNDLIGKALAEKVLEAEPGERFAGEGLRVGAEGMKGFYDDILPRFMNKYGKKWGVTVEDIQLPTLEESAQTMHAVPVTQEMKESVLQGQVMFSFAYHGSAAEFEQFDIGHGLEGEGAMAHGYGHYVSLNYSTALNYAVSGGKKKALENEKKRGNLISDYKDYFWKGTQIDQTTVNPTQMALGVLEAEGTIPAAKKAIERYIRYSENDNVELSKKWEDALRILSVSRKSDFTSRPKDLLGAGERSIYSVEIPDDTGDNYIDEMKTLKKSGRRRIAAVVRGMDDNALLRDTHGPNWLPDGVETLANIIEREPLAGIDLRRRLVDAFGSEKDASKIMHEAGFVGIKYDGRIDGPCAVIFDGNDIKIDKHELLDSAVDIAQLSKNFDEELDRQIAGEYDGAQNPHVYELGLPSPNLLSTGFPNLPIRLKASTLNEKSKNPGHPDDLSELKGLVEAIQKPWAIFSYGDKGKAQNLIIGISRNDKQFLVGIALNPTLKGGVTLEINSVRNVFPKDNYEWLSWIQNNKALRIDEKDKIQAIIDALRINPVDYPNLDLDYIAKIVKNFKNPTPPSNDIPETLQQGSLFTADGEPVKYEALGILPVGNGKDTLAERQFQKSRVFSFTGSDKIESAADIAYLFKQLETEAVENSFMVFVKNGKPTILHMCIGSPTSVAVDYSAVIAGYDEFEPDEIYLVHNHPSGSVRPSKADIEQLEKISTVTGSKVIGVIMDSFSGKFGVFSDESAQQYDRPTGVGAEFPVETLSFDKMVFNRDFVWDSKVMGGAEDIAAYLTAHRIGNGSKVFAVMLSAGRNVVGNLVLSQNVLTRQNARAMARETVNAAVRANATAIVLSGDFKVDLVATSHYRQMLGLLSAGTVSLLDQIKIDGRHTLSAFNNTLRDPVAEESLTSRRDALGSVEAEGLAGILGGDAGELLRSAYRILPDDLREKITDDALGDDVNLRKHLGKYLADLAERGTEKDETGLLRLLYSEIRALSGNDNLSNGDIRYMIWREGRGAVDEDSLLDVARQSAMKRRFGAGAPERVKFSMAKDFSEIVDDNRDQVDETLARLYKEKGETQKAEATSAKAGDIKSIVRAMRAQRVYDSATLAAVVKYAKDILKGGKVEAVTRTEMLKLLTLVGKADGKTPTFMRRYIDQLTDVLLDHIVRKERDRFMELVNIKDTKVTNKGVEALGELDLLGQTSIKALREYMNRSEEDIDRRIAELGDEMESQSEPVQKNAWAEHAGLLLAKDYQRNIIASINEESDIREEIANFNSSGVKKEIGSKAAKEFEESPREALRDNKIERVDSYRTLISSLSDLISGSEAKSREFRLAEQGRILNIQHDANLDMQGVPCDEHRRDTRVDRIINHDATRFLLKPLATFDQMLRLFGRLTPSGEGFLWNRFMRGWVAASERSFLGFEQATKALDEKVSKVYGRKMRWNDLYTEERKMPKANARFFDGGAMKDHELSAGNLLYIYMVDKMVDGRMKLRKMGITASDVEGIKRSLDPKFIELADWIQDEFLVGIRNKYNAVHEAMFGAPMASIEDYFPIKINPLARVEEMDLSKDPDGNPLSSTVTGSIIKRRRNSLALDIMHADAFSVVIEHLQQMEDWAAFAPFRKDLNTLLSYKHFRNQVQNMKTVYGSGRTLWRNFTETASIAAGSYKPKIGKGDLDTVALNVAKGVTAAKIAFRLNTALKQVLSAPAYLADADIAELGKALAHPKGCWEWCMENLPVFRKRLQSRIAGDTRLMDTDSDWKIWHKDFVQKAARWGMAPNAFVDALTISVGAKAMYETKLKKYVKGGMDEEEARTKAMQDATILYNETQQSNEGPFSSSMQLERTWISTMLTTYRNSSMGYQRQVHHAIRSFSRMQDKAYRDRSIRFQTRQLMEGGMEEEDARRFAEKEYERAKTNNAVRLAVFAFLLPLLWNIGVPWYLIFGRNKKKKEEILTEAALKTIAGPVEGLAGGNIMSDAWGSFTSGKGFGGFSFGELPIVSDTKRIVKMMDYDQIAATNEIINIVVQSGFGVNPQTLTDAVTAIIDACNGDLGVAKEAAILMMRVMQVPSSQVDQIYIDELEMSAAKAQRLRVKTLAERYAKYRVNKAAGPLAPAYPEELREKREGSYEKRAGRELKERDNKNNE